MAEKLADSIISRILRFSCAVRGPNVVGQASFLIISQKSSFPHCIEIFSVLILQNIYDKTTGRLLELVAGHYIDIKMTYDPRD